MACTTLNNLSDQSTHNRFDESSPNHSQEFNYQRFEIIDYTSEADMTAMTKAETELFPIKIMAKIIDIIWNRGIKAFFSSKQRQLNAAKNLLEKPTNDLTNAIIFINKINKIFEKINAVPISFQNSRKYIQTIARGKIPIQNGGDVEEIDINTVIFPKDEITTLDSQMLIELNRYQLPFSVLWVDEWRHAIQTVGANLSDAEFRGFFCKRVACLSDKLKENVQFGESEESAQYVIKNAITDWAQTGQMRFIREIATEFSQVVKNIEEDNQGIQAFDVVYAKIINRIRLIHQICNQANVDRIHKVFFTQLNSMPEFKNSLIRDGSKISFEITTDLFPYIQTLKTKVRIYYIKNKWVGDSRRGIFECGRIYFTASISTKSIN